MAGIYKNRKRVFIPNVGVLERIARSLPGGAVLVEYRSTSPRKPTGGTRPPRGRD